MGVGVRECAEEFGADHERGTVVEATPIPFVRARVLLGYLRAGRELDSAEFSAQGRLGLPSGVLSEEQYRPGTLRPGA